MNSAASVYINNEFKTVQDAVGPVKVAIIGAHQDDIPIMYAPAGGEIRQVMGLTLTDGAGAPSDRGPFKNFTKEEIGRIRKYEQIAEAAVGNYNAQFQLAYTSPSVGGRGDANGPQRDDLTREVYNILMMSDKLDEVYVHNPFDKHQSHLAVMRATVEAIRIMPKEKRPNKLIGCEVWRGLDWLMDNSPNKRTIDVSNHIGDMKRGLGQHESQLAGSKGYIEATEGRYRAGLTFANSHAADTSTAASTVVDMSELMNNPTLKVETYIDREVLKLRKALLEKGRQFEPRKVMPDGKGYEAPEVIIGDKLFDVVLPKTIVFARSKFDWQNDELFDSYKTLVRAVVSSSDRGKKDPAETNKELSESSTAFADKIGGGFEKKQDAQALIKHIRTTIAQVKGQGLKI